MKRFINTKFFLVLQEISQNGTDVDIRFLTTVYNEFMRYVFGEYINFHDNIAYRNVLAYTLSELIVIQKFVQKKGFDFY